MLRKQIENARNMGIYAFVVDWYGPRRPFLDRSTALLQKIASEEKFHVGLMYDETQEDNGHATEEAMEAMEVAYKKYIGPEAAGRDAYLTYQGRPVIFVFPKRGHTDWNQVRQQVNQWESPPILLYEDEPAAAIREGVRWRVRVGVSGRQGLDAGRAGMGRRLPEKLLPEDADKHPDQVAVGGVWPGFNDTKASWSLNRHIDARCGKTFEDTLRMFRENDDPAHPIPFVLIATWNDYEEGTAIERGVPHCDESRTASVAREAIHEE